MKISFPLSLKVSLWLVLNLVLLAVVGATFLVKESGFSWDALVTGPAGDRLQAVADVITAELRAAPPSARDETLLRFSDAYGVEFMLFQTSNGRQLGGPTLPAPGLPEAVRQRLIVITGGQRNNGFGGPGDRGGGGRGGGGFGGGGFNGGGFGAGPNGTFNVPGGDPRGGDGRRSGPDNGGARGPTAPNQAPTAAPTATGPTTNALARPATNVFAAVSPSPFTQLTPTVPTSPFGGPPTNRPTVDNNYPRGRFLVRTVEPTAYWAGVRLMPIPDGGGGLVPATLLMHAKSLGATALLLDFTPWLWAAAIAIGLSVLFWLPLVRGITRSLGQLTLATERIAEGKFDTRVDEDRRDEIGRLGSAVNQMAVQLDRAATGQKRFLGDIAHELGSPVGRLQVAVGILEEQAGPALQPAVADVREEVQQMSGLVGELLSFTKAGLRPRNAVLGRVELAPLVAEVLNREAAVGKVTVQLPDGLAVAADEALLSRALANLVRNALRYAGDAGPITVGATSSGSTVIITVEDHGHGVPAGMLERLGEPFFRPEFARTRETGGVGLGLAIVRSAVDACQGTVRFSNREPHGFRVEVRLAGA